MKGFLFVVYAGVTIIILSTIYSFYVLCFPFKYELFVNACADKYYLESALVFSIIKAESGFNERAVSSAGAKGLMQVMEQTAEYIASIYGISINENDYLFNAETNIELGCAYLNYLFKKFNNLGVVICAYNAGEGRVSEWLKTGTLSNSNFSKIPYKETKDYYYKVLFNYKNYTNRLKIRK